MRRLAVSVLAIVSVLVAARRPDGHWSTAKPLPEPPQAFNAAALEGKIYVVGGLDRSSKPTAHAYRYDPATDTWEHIADLPAARHHMPLAVLNDTLYAF